MDPIRIKIEKHADKYVAYPVGLEDKISVEAATREEAVAKVKVAIDSYMDTVAEEVFADYPTHIVAVMGIVRNSEGQILLVKSPRRGWEPPGGQVENGEGVLLALEREILEESGIEVETGRMVAMYSNVTSIPTKLMLTFEANAVGGKLQTSEESPDVGWFSQEEATNKVTHPAQKHKLLDALQNSERIIYRVYGTNPYKMIKTKIV